MYCIYTILFSFNNVVTGTSPLVRSYRYIKLTPRNRSSFFDNLVAAYQSMQQSAYSNNSGSNNSGSNSNSQQSSNSATNSQDVDSPVTSSGMDSTQQQAQFNSNSNYSSNKKLVITQQQQQQQQPVQQPSTANNYSSTQKEFGVTINELKKLIRLVCNDFPYELINAIEALLSKPDQALICFQEFATAINICLLYDGTCYSWST